MRQPAYGMMIVDNDDYYEGQVVTIGGIRCLVMHTQGKQAVIGAYNEERKIKQWFKKWLLPF